MTNLSSLGHHLLPSWSLMVIGKEMGRFHTFWSGTMALQLQMALQSIMFLGINWRGTQNIELSFESSFAQML